MRRGFAFADWISERGLRAGDFFFRRGTVRETSDCWIRYLERGLIVSAIAGRNGGLVCEEDWVDLFLQGCQDIF